MLQGNFDLKGTKYMQGLLDLLELDANKNVRIQVAVIVTILCYQVRQFTTYVHNRYYEYLEI